MRMRLGFMVGMGVGYVMGTRAGRERYTQLQAMARSAMESEPVIKAREKAQELVEQGNGTGGIASLWHRTQDTIDLNRTESLERDGTPATLSEAP